MPNGIVETLNNGIRGRSLGRRSSVMALPAAKRAELLAVWLREHDLDRVMEVLPETPKITRTQLRRFLQRKRLTSPSLDLGPIEETLKEVLEGVSEVAKDVRVLKERDCKDKK